MPTVTVATAGVGIRTQCIDVLQLTNLSPADGDTNLAPGSPISFDLLNSAHSRVYDFEGGTDTGWTRLLYDTGWTHSSWNNGTGDEWDVYHDGSNHVYRAQAQATSVLPEDALVVRDSMSDSVVRVKWFTGATAGLCGHLAWKSSAYKTTYGIYGVGAEIDSGGLRLVRYYNNNGTRGVIATSSFTPTNGTWYWIRLQHVGMNPPEVRAKYWTGARLDEPATWNLAFQDADSLYQAGSSWQYTGFGVRCHGGSAYFDDYEDFCLPDEPSLAKLTVTVDGTDCTVANGRLLVRLNTVVETRGSWTLPVPRVNDWHVEVNWSAFAQAITGTVTVVVEWDGVTLSSTDFDVTRIPGAWPTYDPATDSPSGDPDRMSWFELESATLVEPLGAFCFFRTIFPLSFGYQDGRYVVAMMVWPTSCLEDFTWLLYTPYYTPIDGLYYIGHPVYADAPAAVIAAQPIGNIFPASMIPRGSLERIFPTSVVPQAYIRRDFPANVIVGVVFHHDGTSSGVVGAKILSDFDGSGLIFQRRVGSTIHVHAVTESVYQKLISMGVVFNTADSGRIDVRTASVGIDTDRFII